MSVDKAQHIVILCSRLDLPGGIEKAITQLANLLNEKQYRVTILVLDEKDGTFFPLNETVNYIRHPLLFGITEKGNMLSRKLMLVKDVFQLSGLIKKLNPDCVITTDYNFTVAAVLARIHKKTKLISWEHHHLYELNKNLFWKKLIRLTYPKVNTVVCLNKEESNLFHQLNNNSVTIPNFIEPPLYPKAELINKKILTVGRLTSVKGTDLLLTVAKLVFEQHPDWQWKIIGDGDMKQQVRNFIQQEKLEQNLSISVPLNNNLEKEYANASIYVCPSRHESFGLAIIEAMSLGVPSVSFDCETGPRHIITNNEDGILVEKENPVKLAEAVSSLITNEEKRKKMGQNAAVSMLRFSPDKMYERWKQQFNK